MRRFSSPVVLCGCLALAFGCAPSPDTTGTGGSSGSAGTSGGAGTSGIAGTSGNAGDSGNAGSGSGDAGTTGGSVAGGSGGSTGGSGTGAGGTGGSASTAGTTGTGGRGGTSAGRGGTTGNAGSGGQAGGSTGSGGSSSGNCTFTQSSTISTKIASVATITWSTTLAGATSAKIDFGPTTSYGMSAPISAVTSSNKTMLLGMKFGRMYNYRITAMSGSGSCSSDNFTLTTGALPTGLQKPMITTNNATALFGGFLVTGQYGTTGSGSPAYILDADGDYVWVYTTPNDVTGAIMNYAGTHMWINSANVPSGAAHVRRVTMDGMMEEDLSSGFTGLNHQLTVLPDETVAYYAYGSNGCDDVKERSPTGTVKTVANSKTALKISDAMCHLNNIQYSKDDDSLVFSNLQSTQIAKVKRSDGSTVWILNGSTATITGVTWMGGNHGIHLLALDRLLLFNNNSPTSGGSGGGSIAIELKLDLTAKTATKPWMYKGAGNTFQNDVMGDLQRLSNGNTIIAYSTKGVIVEVDAAGTVLQQLKTQANFGYIHKRATLYGPSPR